MKIERDGKEYELTGEERWQAHVEFVTDWMTETLIDDFGLTEEEAEESAKVAFDYYCDEEGTEYECVVKAYDDYEKYKKENEK